MIVMFSNILVAYLICALLTLLMLIVNKIEIHDKKTDEQIVIKFKAKVILALIWPLLLYRIAQCVKENRE